jgi:hypothetical protein
MGSHFNGLVVPSRFLFARDLGLVLWPDAMPMLSHGGSSPAASSSSPAASLWRALGLADPEDMDTKAVGGGSDGDGNSECDAADDEMWRDRRDRCDRCDRRRLWGTDSGIMLVHLTRPGPSQIIRVACYLNAYRQARFLSTMVS